MDDPVQSARAVVAVRALEHPVRLGNEYRRDPQPFAPYDWAAIAAYATPPLALIASVVWFLLWR